jgi:hypothetical protein
MNNCIQSTSINWIIQLYFLCNLVHVTCTNYRIKFSLFEHDWSIIMKTLLVGSSKRSNVCILIYRMLNIILNCKTG